MIKLLIYKRITALLSLNRYSGSLRALRSEILPPGRVTIDICLEDSSNLIYSEGTKPVVAWKSCYY